MRSIGIPPEVSVCLAALYHHVDLTDNASDTHTKETKQRRRRNRQDQRTLSALVQSTIVHDAAPAIILYLLPPHSIAPLLRPLTKLLRLWPKLLSQKSLDTLPKWMTGEAGPFGYGCGKACEVLGAYLLLSIRYERESTASTSRWIPSLPVAFEIGPLPGRHALLLVLLLSVGVNAVLSVWSNMTRSKGNHAGVDAMVQHSIGRSINFAEHLHLASMALGNAVCEEAVSRGFFYFEFVESAKISTNQANVAQAVAFGVWHYNGIPSGFTGVGLTFVYGVLMGWLKEYGDGLLLPILAHTIADYFIFSIIARKAER